MSRTTGETDLMMMFLLSNQRDRLERLLAPRWLEDTAREVDRLERVSSSDTTHPGFGLIH